MREVSTQGEGEAKVVLTAALAKVDGERWER